MVYFRGRTHTHTHKHTVNTHLRDGNWGTVKYWKRNLICLTQHMIIARLPSTKHISQKCTLNSLLGRHTIVL